MLSTTKEISKEETETKENEMKTREIEMKSKENVSKAKLCDKAVGETKDNERMSSKVFRRHALILNMILKFLDTTVSKWD